MFFLCFFVFVCSIFVKPSRRYHHFNSFTVHVRNEENQEIELPLLSENDVFRAEEEYGRENVRRSYLETNEYKEFLRRATQSNDHYSGLILERWDYEVVHEILRNLSDQYNHCQYGVIGKSSGEHDVYYIRIGTIDENYDDKPEFKLVANIHGDEIVGLVLSVQFAHYLCTFYPSDDRVKEMIDNMNVYVIPSMNPTGYINKRRGNLLNIDLNRNFYDQFRGEPDQPIQPETQLMMDFTEDKNFVLGIHCHGGAQVVSYPWDGNSNGQNQRGKYSASPDDSLFLYMSTEYANLNPMFHASEFPTGVTNGADWYTLYGGIQDWEYLYREINTVTIELSNSKQPANIYMNEYWNANFEALMRYSSFTYKLGVRGRVTDYAGHPLPNAEIHVEGIEDHAVTTSQNGRFSRLLVPGVYRVGVKVPNDEQWISVDLTDSNPEKQFELNFVVTNESKGQEENDDDDDDNDEDDDDDSGNLMKYLIWINTAIGMSFCCCCCLYAILLYSCFFLGCFVAFARGKKKGGEMYFGMPLDEEEVEEGEEGEGLEEEEKETPELGQGIVGEEGGQQEIRREDVVEAVVLDAQDGEEGEV